MSFEKKKSRKVNERESHLQSFNGSRGLEASSQKKTQERAESEDSINKEGGSSAGDSSSNGRLLIRYFL
jgi:hypothetical protein